MKKLSVVITTILFILTIIVFALSGNKKDVSKRGESRKDENCIVEEDFQKEDREEPLEKKNWENLSNMEGDFQKTDKDTLTKGKKIELTDYLELSIEEFIKETGISLYQDQENENIWKTKDNKIYVETDGKGISYLSIDNWSRDNPLEESADTEEFCYTIAGISLNDDISELEKTILKDAKMETGGGCYSYYTSLELSRLGIERMILVGMFVDSIGVYVDLSLKENSKNLEYIWGEKIVQKEGICNDELVTSKTPYTELPQSYMQTEKVDKTIVWIKYPCLEIPDRPEVAQNANNLIQTIVEKIEDETYRSTDKCIIVQAEYMITYMTSKFISIAFKVYVNGNDIEEKFGHWQYCNINIANNGEGATLADIGLTKEEIASACYASSEYPIDTEGYLKEYDINWSKYCITPVKYILFVKGLDEDDIFPIELFRSWYG